MRDNEIHIWTIATKAPEAVVTALEHVLADDETERAARFRFQHLRDSYIVVRGTLRHVLGSYLNDDPAAIRFGYGPKGKPALAGPGDTHFNVSHSGGVAVIAITTGCEVGIDVEQIKPLPDMEQIAGRFFCAEEAAEILAMPDAEREGAFFSCWTRKEAYIKAVGDGLSIPLDGFRVAVLPDEAVRMIHLNNDRAAAGEWSLHDLPVAPNCAAAVAYRDLPRPISFHSIAELAGYPRPR